MRTTIILNKDDIKILIAEKYNIDIKNIKEEYFGPQQDGIYCNNGGCFFSFEKKIPFKEVEYEKNNI